MDPKLIEILLKIGAPGGMLTVIAALLYVAITQYNDIKILSNARILDKEKTHDVLDKLVSAQEKQAIINESRFDTLDKETDNLSDDLRDIKDDLKHIGRISQ